MATDKRPKSGPASFGFKRKDGRLVPHPEEAPIRLRVFELFAEHQRKQIVAEMLNLEGHRTRAGVIFTAQSVGRLLVDRSVLGSDGVEALVSLKLFERCTDILAAHKRSGGAKRTVAHLFAGYVHCTCGQKMYVPSNIRTAKYVCRDCRTKIASDDLDSVFHAQLKHYDDPSGTRSVTDTLHSRWHSLSFKDKRDLVETITNRIEVGDKKVTCFLISI